MINRRTVAAILAKKFINDYDEVMKHYTVEQQVELTGHLLKIIELLQEYQEGNDDNLFKKWQKEGRIIQSKKSAYFLYWVFLYLLF